MEIDRRVKPQIIMTGADFAQLVESGMEQIENELASQAMLNEAPVAVPMWRRLGSAVREYFSNEHAVVAIATTAILGGAALIAVRNRQD